MNIALTAPTGKIGTALLGAARQRGVAVRALARDATRLKIPADSVSFDFADPSTHARALDGVETLVLVSPPSPRQAEDDCAVIDAARAAGVRHVIKVSGEGAEHGATRFAVQHRIVEEHLRASGLGVTMVRPTFFMENLLGIAAAIADGVYPAPTASAPMTQVAVADIAAVLLAVATSPAQHRDTAYTLTGPTASSGEEIAADLAMATGRPVRYVDVPEAAFAENLARAGVDEWSAGGILEAYRKVRAGGSATVSNDFTRITGRAPIDLTTWARAALARE